MGGGLQAQIAITFIQNGVVKIDPQLFHSWTILNIILHFTISSTKLFFNVLIIDYMYYGTRKAKNGTK